GLVNVLPTGRNFYSVDPRALPTQLAWETGQDMADSLLRRHLDETGEYPRSVGLSVWGTSAMRTSGDDIAEVFALLGVRPVWDDASRRIVDLRPVDLAELGRPRIDVTVRISGFFRDAFPHVLGLLDDAVQLSPDSTSRPSRTSSRPPSSRTWPRGPSAGAPPPGCSAPNRGRTGPDCCSWSTRARGATTPIWPPSTPSGADTPTAGGWTGSPPGTTCAAPTAGSRWRPRTSTRSN